MHPTQKVLLKRLLKHNQQRYAALTQGYGYEANVVFHLKQLLARGFVKKSDQLYAITTSGIKTITTYDLKDLNDRKFKTFFAGFLCSYQDSWLVKEHDGVEGSFHNLPSGKPWFGEKVEDSLPRLFGENIGRIMPPAAFSFRSLHLKTVKTSAGDVLFDDAFTIYSVVLSKDDYEHMQLAEGNKWIPTPEISALPHRWPEIDVCILQNSIVPYLAYEFVSDYVLCSQGNH